MFLVNATTAAPAGLVLLSLFASLLVSERYNSITSGTRRTALDPASNFDGSGGGGGVGGAIFPFTSLGNEGVTELGLGGGLGIFIVFSAVASMISVPVHTFSTPGFCSDTLMNMDGLCCDASV